jgi:chromosome segregation ATPase
MKNFLMSLLWVALFAALGAMYWFQTSFDVKLLQMNERAGLIEEKYQSFTDRLHDLEVKFEGRAKHVRQNQQGIKALNENLDEFKSEHRNDMYLVNARVDSVGAVVDNNAVVADNQIKELRTTATTLRQNIITNNNTATQNISRLNRDLENLKKQLDDLDLKVAAIQEEAASGKKRR